MTRMRLGIFDKRNLALLVAAAAAVPCAVAAASGEPGFMLMALALPLAAGVMFFFSHPHLILWVLVLTVPFTDLLGIPLGDINLRPYNLLAVAGGVLLLWATAGNSKSAYLVCARKMLPAFIPLVFLVFCKITTVALLEGMPPGMGKVFSAKYVAFSTLLFLTAFVTGAFITNRETLLKVVLWWLHMANIILIIALLQILLSNAFGFDFVHHRDVIFFGRPYSVFREPDVLGSFLGATVMMVLPLIIYRHSYFSRRYLLATLMAHAVFLVVVFVRAAWVGTVFAIVVMLASVTKAGILKKTMVYLNRAVLLGLAVLVLLPVFSPRFAIKLFERFASFTRPKAESGSEYRMRELVIMSAKTVPVSWSGSEFKTFLLGHGDFSWSYWAPHLLGENYDRTAIEMAEETGEVLVHPGFCMALAVFFDNGILGAAFYLLFFLIMFSRYSKYLHNKRGTGKSILLMSVFLPVVCILTCFQFSYDPITPFLWVLIGLFFAACNLEEGGADNVKT